MLTSDVNRLPLLTARPPTPPHDTDEYIEDAIAFLNSDIEPAKGLQLLSSQQISSSTPPDSSPLRPTTLAGNVSISKRVEFLSTPIFHPPRDTTAEAASPKSSPARSKLLRPSKSILKSGSVSPVPIAEDRDSQTCYFSCHLPQTFAKMLESTLKQLGSTSKYSRLDAYLALNGALTTYEDVPDQQEMSRHMNAFQGLILRDTNLRELEETNDMQIVTQAFKLAARILAYEDFLRSTDADFQSSILDRSITVIEHPSLSKSIVKSVLGLLAQQDLPTTILTSVRVDRMVSALRDIDTRYPGSSIIAIRITIYQRLIRHSPSTMLIRMKDWLSHSLNGMISDTTDLRSRAIEVCKQAGLEFGGNAIATRVLHDLLEAELEDGATRYYEHFTLRLAQFTRTDNIRSSVPSIWSALVLFHRSLKMPIHTWRRFRSWLTIMQPCLLHSDSELRCQAHSAWRKLIYVVRLDSSMPAALVNVLTKPMRTAFDRRGADRNSKELRRLALDGYYNLLHYAFRPGLGSENLDFAWTNFLVDTIKVIAPASTKGRHFASRILRGLFTANAGAWNPAAALETTAILPEDLPRLDVRWVRSRLSKILPLLDLVLLPMVQSPIFEHYTLGLEMWSSLIQCVVQAGAHEVRLSIELKTAIADIVNFLRRLTAHNVHLTPSTEATVVKERLLQLQVATLKRFGLNHLSEDFIPLRSSTEEASLAQIQSSPSTVQDVMVSPLTFVLSYAPIVSPLFAQSVLTLLCSTKTTDAAKIQLLSRAWQVLSSKQDCLNGSIAVIWTAIASMLNGLINAKGRQPSLEVSAEALQALGAGKSLLAACFSLTEVEISTLHSLQWLTISSIRLAEGIAGETGPAVALIEPLSKMQTTEQKQYNLQVAHDFVITILRTISWPQNSRSDERAYKALAGVTGGQKSGALVYEHFITFLNQVMQSCYDQVCTNSPPTAMDEVMELLYSFMSSSSDRVGKVLERLQPGISIWIEDAQRRLSNTNDMSKRRLSHSWSKILLLLRLHQEENIFSPRLVEKLLVTGLRSTSIEVVNDTITFWNETSEAQKTVQYTEELQQVIRALNTVALIRVPQLTVSVDSPIQELSAMQAQPNTIEESLVADEVATPRIRSFAHRAGFSERAERTVPPSTARSNSKKLFKSPHKRHDDSQVDFMPIEQPPTSQTQDSQLLTDNQREVRDRQHADMQQYPELSSSPIRLWRKPPMSEQPRPEAGMASSGSRVASVDVNMPDVHVASSPVANITLHAEEHPTAPLNGSIIVASSVPNVESVAFVDEEVSHTNNGQTHQGSPVVERVSNIEAQSTGTQGRRDSDVDLPDVQLQLETEMAASLEESFSTEKSSMVAAALVNANIAGEEQAASYTSKLKINTGKRKRGRVDEEDEKRSRRKLKEEVLHFSNRNDDDIEDCIVVASSQQWRQSQASQNVPATPRTEVATHSTLLPNHSSGASANDSVPRSTKKRGRRSRRGQISQDDSPNSGKKTTPYIPATVAVRNSIDSREDQHVVVFATDVAVSSADVVDQTDIDATDQVTSTETGGLPAHASRGFTGILDLLREALVGLKTSVFGQKEGKDVDDMLRKLRKANHEAVRRGTETTG